ncbi:hypothetical protein ANTHELSMS3_01869 [Antarctobacter heliothermus]|uniref:Uncharacterized protein n=1 Tax=Antarctobacter heliothermus TaxID=74033 RepID=A0A222E2X9_9RHOB|nr:hypothetical protein ANTHELSMS3_01869 [Antarctobacter heliothermus]
MDLGALGFQDAWREYNAVRLLGRELRFSRQLKVRQWLMAAAVSVIALPTFLMSVFYLLFLEVLDG